MNYNVEMVKKVKEQGSDEIKQVMDMSEST